MVLEKVTSLGDETTDGVCACFSATQRDSVRKVVNHVRRLRIYNYSGPTGRCMDGKTAELIISYSTFRDDTEGIIRKGLALITKGDGNVDMDPKFRDPAGADEVVGTVDDDLALRAGSPCIDSGYNKAVPADTDDLDLDDDLLEHIPLDLAGQARFADDPDTADTGVADEPTYLEIVDIGAYEYIP